MAPEEEEPGRAAGWEGWSWAELAGVRCRKQEGVLGRPGALHFWVVSSRVAVGMSPRRGAGQRPESEEGQGQPGLSVGPVCVDGGIVLGDVSPRVAVDLGQNLESEAAGAEGDSEEEEGRCEGRVARGRRSPEASTEPLRPPSPTPLLLPQGHDQRPPEERTSCQELEWARLCRAAAQLQAWRCPCSCTYLCAACSP